MTLYEYMFGYPRNQRLSTFTADYGCIIIIPMGKSAILLTAPLIDMKKVTIVLYVNNETCKISKE